MAAEDARQRIQRFLEQQLFRPVLDDDPQGHPPFRRGDVEEVHRRVGREWEQIHRAPSAGAMLRAFHDAAERSAVTELEQLLRTLRLPTFGSIRPELDKLADELDIDAEATPAGQIS